MIAYIESALGLAEGFLSTDFGAFAGLMLITITVFGVSKLILIGFSNFFGGTAL